MTGVIPFVSRKRSSTAAGLMAPNVHFKRSKSGLAKPKISLSQLPKCVKPEIKKLVRTIEGTAMQALTENLIVQKPFAHIQTGSQQDQRVGNKICLHSIKCQGHLENRSSVANTMLVRMAILRDKAYDQSTFSGIEALIKNNVPVNLGTLGAESSYLDWNKDRYDVIYNKVFKLGSDSSSGSNIKLFNFTKKLGGKKATFSYQTGAPNAITSGNYQVVMWACDPDNAGQSTSSVNGYIQTTGNYTDP